MNANQLADYWLQPDNHMETLSRRAFAGFMWLPINPHQQANIGYILGLLIRRSLVRAQVGEPDQKADSTESAFVFCSANRGLLRDSTICRGSGRRRSGARSEVAGWPGMAS